MATPGSEKRLHPLAFFDKAEATVTSAFYLERCRELRFVRAGAGGAGMMDVPSAEMLRFDAETSLIFISPWFGSMTTGILSCGLSSRA